jgi:hypothetical protein
MGVSICLTGRFASGGSVLRASAPKTRLRGVERWFLEHCLDTLIHSGSATTQEGNPLLVVRLHPGAEDIQIVSSGRSRLTVLAKTSSAGPGYHVHVCDVLKRLGDELGIAWDPPNPEEGTGDEIGYFHTGDRACVADAMLNGLDLSVRNLLSYLDMGARDMAIALGTDVGFHHDGVIATPMGPRDRAWLNAVARDARRGIDIFPWWDAGFGAPYYLSRALCQMWTDVRWRPPLTEPEARVLGSVADSLARAYEIGPTIDYPWREWQEILEYLGVDDPITAEVARMAANLPDSPRIGYRRRDVTAKFPGGWSITIPGSFAGNWSDSGSVWCGWEDSRTVWFRSVSFCCDGEVPDEILDFRPWPAGEIMHYRPGSLVSKACLGRESEEGKSFWRLTARAVAKGSLATFSVDFLDAADRAWAIDTWRSVLHSDVETRRVTTEEG